MVDKKVKNQNKKQDENKEVKKETVKKEQEICKVKSVCGFWKSVIVLIIIVFVLEHSVGLWGDLVPEKYRDYFMDQGIEVVDNSQELDILRGEVVVLENKVLELSNKKDDEININSLVANVDEKILVIENQNKQVQKNIETLQVENKEIRASMASAASVLGILTRIDKIEQRIEKMSAKSDKGAIMLMSVMQLKEAVYRGDDFSVELETVSLVTKGNRDAKMQIDEIYKYMKTGIFKKEILIEEFDKYRKDMINASLGDEKTSMGDKVLAKLRELVNFKRLDVEDEESVEVIVNNVKAYLKYKDINAAYKELMKIKEVEILQISEKWQKQVKAVMAVDSAISKLSAMAMAQIKADRL